MDARSTTAAFTNRLSSLQHMAGAQHLCLPTPTLVTMHGSQDALEEGGCTALGLLAHNSTVHFCGAVTSSSVVCFNVCGQP
jgi:hypothetical protein